MRRSDPVRFDHHVIIAREESRQVPGGHAKPPGRVAHAAPGALQDVENGGDSRQVAFVALPYLEAPARIDAVADGLWNAIRGGLTQTEGELFLKAAQGTTAVLGLRPALLGDDAQAGRFVAQADCRVSLVPLLAARTRRPVRIYLAFGKQPGVVREKRVSH